MRVRLTDGTHEVEITAHRWLGPRRLANLAAALLDHINEQPADSNRDAEQPFGFSLDSTTERAEPYDDGRGTDYDDEDDHA